MSDELLTRLRTRRREEQEALAPADIPAAPLATSQPGDEETPDAFGRVGSNRRQEVMLELRLVSGDCKAIAYAFLVSINFDPSAGITLEFTGHRVSLKGRNLRPLFRGLVAHRIAYVQEVDSNAAALASETDTVVTGIQVAEV